MISLRRPNASAVAAYRQQRLGIEPTCLPADNPPAGYRVDAFSRVIGHGHESFDRARAGLQQWVAHRGSGVEISPASAQLVVGETVTILTRQLGLWVLAACRVEIIIDEPTAFGFVYATLPGHPENGYESFVAREVDDQVTFHIEAVTKPGLLIVRLGAPVTSILQRRATAAYLDALEQWVQHPY